MNRILLILRNEVHTVLRSKAYLVTTFGLPLLAAMIFLGITLLRRDTSPRLGTHTASPDTPQLQTEGYVDYSGLIKVIPEDLPNGALAPFPDEASAYRALSASEISAYYVIPADYVESGDLVYIDPEYRPASSEGQAWVMQRTIYVNLLGNDPALIAHASQPMEVRANPLAQTAERDRDNPMTFYVPYATMMLLYMLIMLSSGLLLHSISAEKKNQVMEVLLLSVNPLQILVGKIVGLGAVGLLQAIIWFGLGYAILSIGGRGLSLPTGSELPPSILVWGLLFYLLGYAVYASLMAGLGALMPNLKEASQMVILVIWPLLIPLLLIVVLVENTHGILATGLSLFPLTAPIAMMTRLAAGNVPLWQPLMAILLLLFTAVLVVRAAAQIFRAQALLSGQSVSARRFYAALLGQ
jgi:ABC-2 type transport system permease protein